MAYLPAQQPAPVPSLIASFGSAVLHRLAQRRSYRVTRDELERLSDRELMDLGLSRHDIRTIAAQSAAHH